MAIRIVVAIATEHVCHITSIQKPHISAVTVLTIEHNLIDFMERAWNLNVDFLQHYGRWYALMASDYHEHQPVQRLQILQFNFVQDYGEVISVVLVTKEHYVGVASLSDCDNSLIIAQLLRKMLRKSACSECCCCQAFTQQEQILIAIRLYSSSPGNRQYSEVPTSTA